MFTINVYMHSCSNYYNKDFIQGYKIYIQERQHQYGFNHPPNISWNIIIQENIKRKIIVTEYQINLTINYVDIEY